MPKYSPRSAIGMAPPVNATTEELGAATVLFLAALALEDGVSQGYQKVEVGVFTYWICPSEI